MSSAPANADRRGELARFLRARRASVSPSEAGIEPDGRRRSSGLRRSEVAVLAGMSETYYTYLEQARDVHPSRNVLDALSRVLLMSEDERRYVHHLVFGSAGTTIPFDEELPSTELVAQIIALSDGSDYPVYGCNQYFDLIAWNPACTDWYGDWSLMPAQDRNVLLWMLTAPEARVRLVDWEDVVRDAVARWRSESSRHPDDPEINARTARLRAASPEDFVAMWEALEVTDHRSAVRRLNHPRWGVCHLRVVPVISPSFSTGGIVYHVPARPRDMVPLSR